MILYDPDSPDLAREFWGQKAIWIEMAGWGREREIRVKPGMRAMWLALSGEVEQRFRADIMLTHFLRSWAKQDEIYRDNQGLPLEEKKASVHQLGRGGDGIIVIDGLLAGPRVDEAYLWAEDYLNEEFPYCWNNHSRPTGRYKTAMIHEVIQRDAAGRIIKRWGKHLHSQLSW